jgi:membrane associated rhomboid family serine protease
MRPASVGFHCPDDVKLGARSIRAARTVAGAPVTSGPAITTWSLIGFNVLIYVFTAAGSHDGIGNPQSSRLYEDWVMSPFLVARHDEFARLITATFLHVSVTHIALNMLTLGFIGPFLERAMGWWRYLAVYLLSALGGSVLVFCAGNHVNTVAGASGAIYGLFAAALLLMRRLQLDTRALLATIALNFVITFAIPNISAQAHIGGFIVGGVATLCIIGWPQLKTRLTPPVQVAAMSSLAVLLVIVIVVRTTTFPG